MNKIKRSAYLPLRLLCLYLQGLNCSQDPPLPVGSTVNVSNPNFNCSIAYTVTAVSAQRHELTPYRPLSRDLSLQREASVLQRPLPTQVYPGMGSDTRLTLPAEFQVIYAPLFKALLPALLLLALALQSAYNCRIVAAKVSPADPEEGAQPLTAALLQSYNPGSNCNDLIPGQMVSAEACTSPVVGPAYNTVHLKEP